MNRNQVITRTGPSASWEESSWSRFQLSEESSQIKKRRKEKGRWGHGVGECRYFIQKCCCKREQRMMYLEGYVDVGSSVRHYWQNGGTALNPLPLFRRHGPGMKELGFVILTCFFLSSADLTEENIKVLIVFERSMRRHKAFCSCAQRIIHKVNHWHLFKEFYNKVFQSEHTGCSLRPL